MTNSLPLRQYLFTDFGGEAHTQTGPSSTTARYRRRPHPGHDHAVAAGREGPGRSGQTGEGSTLMHRCAS